MFKKDDLVLCVSDRVVICNPKIKNGKIYRVYDHIKLETYTYLKIDGIYCAEKKYGLKKLDVSRFVNLRNILSTKDYDKVENGLIRRIDNGEIYKCRRFIIMC